MSYSVYLNAYQLCGLLSLIIVLAINLFRARNELKATKARLSFVIRKSLSVEGEYMYDGCRMNVIFDAVRYSGNQFYLMRKDQVMASFHVEPYRVNPVLDYFKSNKIEPVQNRP
ncbi:MULTISPECIES: hypothetical protein [Vibrio]|uniref:hypothetical protein n=1 Tax=Vibrio TaxID=662 RepID=UPI000D64AB22|nr:MULTISPECIES: hypothetical protein [Vibrio]MCS0376612.1 hypothetical protein [Vibrio diabolicus]MCS0433797.1 hypothetical protein [Vibrio diabolicus]PWF69579.1 hypothetical protein CBX98_20195 [Vibrio sp. T9]